MSGFLSLIRRNSVVAPRAAEAPAPRAPAIPAAPADGLANRLGRAVFNNPVANGVGGVVTGIRGRVGEVRERAGQAVDNVAGRVKGAVDAAKQKKDQLVDEAKGEVKGVARRMSDSKEAVAQGVYEGAGKVYRGVLRQVGPFVFRKEESDGEEEGHPAVPAPAPAAAKPHFVEEDGGPCDDELLLRMCGFQPGDQLVEIDISDLRLVPALQQYIVEIRESALLFAAIARPNEPLEEKEKFVTLFMNSAFYALRGTVREEDRDELLEWSERCVMAIEKALAGFLFAHLVTLNQFLTSDIISNSLQLIDSTLPAIKRPIGDAIHTFKRVTWMIDFPTVDPVIAMGRFVQEYVKEDRLEELDAIFDSMEEELGVKETQKKAEKWLRLLDEGWKRRRERLGN